MVKRFNQSSILVILALFMTNSIAAQIDTISVTAQKRTEQAQKIPVSMSVLNATTINQLQLNNILKEVFSALHTESKLWIAYPKTTSKIVSDLNRDASWEILSKNDYEAVRQVTLDHVWIAMRFKKLDQIPNRNRTFVEFKAANIKIDDFEKRLIALPIELDKLFAAHEEAREFFTSLSILHQKEYLSWIQGAKKEETKQKRLEATLEKLLAGKNSPSEK
mgnify:CR=1 FL=1